MARFVLWLIPPLPAKLTPLYPLLMVLSIVTQMICSISMH